MLSVLNIECTRAV